MLAAEAFEADLHHLRMREATLRDEGAAVHELLAELADARVALERAQSHAARW